MIALFNRRRATCMNALTSLSCFPPFSLIPYTTLLSETHLAYPIVFFPLVFFLSSDPISPPLVGFRQWVYDRSNSSSFSRSHPWDSFLPVMNSNCYEFYFYEHDFCEFYLLWILAEILQKVQKIQIHQTPESENCFSSTRSSWIQCK